MSISIDYSKLDQVFAFTTFLKVIQDPKELTDLLDNLQAQAKELRELVSAKTKIDEIDSYVEAEKVKIAQLWVDVNQKQAELVTQSSQLEDTKKTLDQKYQNLENIQQVNLDKFNKRQEELDELQVQLNADKEALIKEKELLIKKNQELLSQEAVLAEKTAKLRTILGE